MDSYTVKNEIDDFSYEEYHFFQSRREWILQYYYLYRRATKRHGYKIEKRYNRIDRRGNTVSVEEIEITQTIKDKLLNAIIADFRVEKEI